MMQDEEFWPKLLDNLLKEEEEVCLAFYGVENAQCVKDQEPE